ncbi:flagellar basal body L-ring protein FlgH [Polycladidibacter stylochi]|uniref:flagellar basal body L-ring protein FlgH n=1 Tax=Polycladidibacter stylochi TaxID=1807766 RepID=UPI00082B264D|nr:flagellar basal body L-ring protein FlgH [Pseudovibrio stylochi]
MRKLMIIAALTALGGCSTVMSDIGREPELTPLGDGLHPKIARSSFAVPNQNLQKKRSFHGLWAKDKQNFFKDPRAHDVGDVVTVLISINDNAQLDNTSERKRNSSAKNGIGGSFKWGTVSTGSMEAQVSGTGGSTMKGEGQIDRAEKINLSIAAVVTRVLPNGNLIISGQQEVRVNFEIRVLNVAGIVRPMDITGRNTIAYDKIAEARVSYGGRGQMTQMQQPGLGQQVFDKISPF